MTQSNLVYEKFKKDIASIAEIMDTNIYTKYPNIPNTTLSIHYYDNKMGDLIYGKLRIKNNKTGKKIIKPFHFVNGVFCYGEPNFENKKPMYNLKNLSDLSIALENPKMQSDPLKEFVFFVEGEQKADMLNHIGFCATTTGGATSIARHDLSPLFDLAKRTTVILWRDYDSSGNNWLRETLLAINDMSEQYAYPINELSIHIIEVEKLQLNKSDDVVDYIMQHYPSFPNSNLKDIQNLLMSLPFCRLSQDLIDELKKENAKTTNSEQQNNQYAINDNDEWEKPLDISSYNTNNLTMDFDCSRLTPNIAQVARTVVEKYDVPIDLVVQAILGVTSACITQLITVKSYFQQISTPTNLFLLGLARSGIGKSVIQNIIYKPLIEHDNKKGREHDDEWNNQDLNNPTTMPKIKPQFVPLIMDNTTVESLVNNLTLVTNNRTHAHIKTAEATSFFGGKGFLDNGKPNIATATTFIKLSDVSDIDNSRVYKTASKQYRSKTQNVSVSMDLFGQPDPLHNILNDPNLHTSGFFARCILAIATDTFKPREIEPDPNYFSTHNSRPNQNYDYHIDVLHATKIKKLVTLQDQIWLDTTQKEDNVATLTINPFRNTLIGFADKQVLKKATDFANEYLKQAHNERNPHLEAIKARLGEMMLKMAGVIAVYESQTDSIADIKKVTIDDKALSLAIYLAERSLHNWTIVLKNSSVYSTPQPAEQLIDWLVATCKKKNLTEIGKSNAMASCPKNLRNKNTFDSLLGQLIELNHIKVENIDGKLIIKLNPELL